MFPGFHFLVGHLQDAIGPRLTRRLCCAGRTDYGRYLALVWLSFVVLGIVFAANLAKVMRGPSLSQAEEQWSSDSNPGFAIGFGVYLLLVLVITFELPGRCSGRCDDDRYLIRMRHFGGKRILKEWCSGICMPCLTALLLGITLSGVAHDAWVPRPVLETVCEDGLEAGLGNAPPDFCQPISGLKRPFVPDWVEGGGLDASGLAGMPNGLPGGLFGLFLASAMDFGNDTCRMAVILNSTGKMLLEPESSLAGTNATKRASFAVPPDGSRKSSTLDCWNTLPDVVVCDALEASGVRSSSWASSRQPYGDECRNTGIAALAAAEHYGTTPALQSRNNYELASLLLTSSLAVGSGGGSGGTGEPSPSSSSPAGGDNARAASPTSSSLSNSPSTGTSRIASWNANRLAQAKCLANGGFYDLSKSACATISVAVGCLYPDGCHGTLLASGFFEFLDHIFYLGILSATSCGFFLIGYLFNLHLSYQPEDHRRPAWIGRGPAGVQEGENNDHEQVELPNWMIEVPAPAAGGGEGENGAQAPPVAAQQQQPPGGGRQLQYMPDGIEIEVDDEPPPPPQQQPRLGPSDLQSLRAAFDGADTPDRIIQACQLAEDLGRLLADGPPSEKEKLTAATIEYGKAARTRGGEDVWTSDAARAFGKALKACKA